ncbi:hypothetical protein NKJ46_13615 [Mesorhizobium sp. M0166]
MVIPQFAEQPASIELSATGLPLANNRCRIRRHATNGSGLSDQTHSCPAELEGGRYHTAYGNLTENFHGKLFKNKYPRQE